ncbi:hypothetical protein [Lamprobacter modestohalophilus]|uniref:hypothetical protein n=1 Tax=Lamprobacter modestohalophilus TaxID=1064514 RepID=UPI001907BFB7|nr:hypothetical protein [Lamprobacter modestohalophilus]
MAASLVAAGGRVDVAGAAAVGVCSDADVSLLVGVGVGVGLGVGVVFGCAEGPGLLEAGASFAADFVRVLERTGFRLLAGEGVFGLVVDAVAPEEAPEEPSAAGVAAAAGAAGFGLVADFADALAASASVVLAGDFGLGSVV